MFSRLSITLCTLFMTAACSGDTNDNNAESSIDKTNKEIAAKAVAAIQDPLNKALDAAQIAEEHTRQIEEEAQNMSK